MKGTVYKSTGSWYIIKDENGEFRNARMKGFLIVVVSLYNSKKIIAVYKAKDFVAVLGFLGITIVYNTLIVLFGTGRGR